MLPRSYTNPEAFRQALEQRVRSSAGGAGMARFRQILVFDRFLARVFAHFGDRAILKGGVVLVPVVRGFLDPVLASDEGTWDPTTWTWQRE